MHKTEINQSLLYFSIISPVTITKCLAALIPNPLNLQSLTTTVIFCTFCVQRTNYTDDIITRDVIAHYVITHDHIANDVITNDVITDGVITNDDIADDPDNMQVGMI